MLKPEQRWNWLMLQAITDFSCSRYPLPVQGRTAIEWDLPYLLLPSS
jgi:hypothetical protein